MELQNNQLQHVALVMDGNARWAKERGLSKAEGHKSGAENVKNLLKYFLEFNISHLTLFAFSYENWQRSNEEVSYIFNLLTQYLNNEISILHKNEIKIKFIGNFERLNNNLLETIKIAEKSTEKNSKLSLYIAFSYGGRKEIIDACQKVINLGIKDINQENFKKFLYEPNMPDVDLLIRTGGVLRISNFLLWQSAYAELYFTPKYWPDFNEIDLIEAINDYKKRIRSFGGRKT